MASKAMVPSFFTYCTIMNIKLVNIITKNINVGIQPSSNYSYLVFYGRITVKTLKIIDATSKSKLDTISFILTNKSLYGLFLPRRLK